VFDTLDFDVFSNQKWDRLQESHAKDIVVTWPDGHETHGLDRHIDDLKALFVFAPDINIEVHPVRFGSGSGTAVTGVMTGTFTRPMPVGDGKFVQPTGRRFAIGMATIGHWKDGTMDYEWLFWDNQDFMKQIGLASRRTGDAGAGVAPGFTREARGRAQENRSSPRQRYSERAPARCCPCPAGA
jgi:hypothetical protein